MDWYYIFFVVFGVVFVLSTIVGYYYEIRTFNKMVEATKEIAVEQQHQIDDLKRELEEMKQSHNRKIVEEAATKQLNYLKENL
jgi:threonyl-tRNA synthetase